MAMPTITPPVIASVSAIPSVLTSQPPSIDSLLTTVQNQIGLLGIITTIFFGIMGIAVALFSAFSLYLTDKNNKLSKRTKEYSEATQKQYDKVAEIMNKSQILQTIIGRYLTMVRDYKTEIEKASKEVKEIAKITKKDEKNTREFKKKAQELFTKLQTDFSSLASVSKSVSNVSGTIPTYPSIDPVKRAFAEKVRAMEKTQGNISVSEPLMDIPPEDI